MLDDFPDDNLASMAAWLLRHLGRIRHHGAAGDIHREITAAVRDGWAVVNLPEQRVYAGPCDCGHGELLSWPGRALATCDVCGTAYGIAERQEWMRSRLASHLAAAHEASVMLAGIGIHVSDGTIRMWHHRGQLEPHFPDGVAHPRYRLGDIAARAVARDTRAGLAMAEHRAIIMRGDARHIPLADSTVDLVVTSPPFWQLRSYTDGGLHYDGQLGDEPTPREYIDSLLEATRDWVRVLKPSGSLFVELGDKYAAAPGAGPNAARGGRNVRPTPRTTIPPKCLLDLPHRYVIRCVDELGLIKRAEIIWHHVNGLPESVTDRARRAHSVLFHLVKQPRYYAAVDEIREPHSSDAADRRTKYLGNDPGTVTSVQAIRHDGSPNGVMGFAANPLGKLPGSVWSIPSQPLTVPAHLGVDHFAAFPMELPRRCVLGWSPPGICTRCGEGRRPVVDKRYLSATHDGRDTNGERARHGTCMAVGRSKMTNRWGDGTEATITGYACACPAPDAPTRPAVVLDPFSGTGTTLLAAAALGRVGIGVNLSADYCRLARWRVNDPGERAKAMQVPKPPPVPDGMEALF